MDVMFSGWSLDWSSVNRFFLTETCFSIGRIQCQLEIKCNLQWFMAPKSEAFGINEVMSTGENRTLWSNWVYLEQCSEITEYQDLLYSCLLLNCDFKFKMHGTYCSILCKLWPSWINSRTKKKQSPNTLYNKMPPSTKLALDSIEFLAFTNILTPYSWSLNCAHTPGCSL